MLHRRYTRWSSHQRTNFSCSSGFQQVPAVFFRPFRPVPSPVVPRVRAPHVSHRLKHLPRQDAVSFHLHVSSLSMSFKKRGTSRIKGCEDMEMCDSIQGDISQCLGCVLNYYLVFYLFRKPLNHLKQGQALKKTLILVQPIFNLVLDEN